MKNKYHTE